LDHVSPAAGASRGRSVFAHEVNLPTNIGWPYHSKWNLAGRILTVAAFAAIEIAAGYDLDVAVIEMAGLSITVQGRLPKEATMNPNRSIVFRPELIELMKSVLDDATSNAIPKRSALPR